MSRIGSFRPSEPSVTAALLQMPGFTLTEYDGGSANFEAAERILTLIAPDGGRAQVNREGTRIEADTSIRYSEASGRVQTVGQSTFTPQTRSHRRFASSSSEMRWSR